MTPTPAIVPPHNLAAERHLLGGLIVDSRTLPECMTLIPGPEAFWVAAHAALYGVIVSLAVGRGPIDLPALEAATVNHATIREAGGAAWIAKIAEESPGPATLTYHARIVREMHQRRMLALVGETLTHAAKTTDREPDDLAADAAAALGKAVGDNNAGTIKLGAACDSVVAELCAGKPAFLPSPWPEFDVEFGGIPSGCVSTVMGTPSSGKTTLCLQMLLNLAKRELPCMIFSNEQSAKRVAATMLTMESGVQVHDRWGRGSASVEEIRSVQQASERLAALPIEQVPNSINAQQIVHQAKFAKQRGFRVVFVDYLQQIPALPGCNSDRERIAESMKMLCRIRDLDMTLILVSQIDKSTSKATAISGDAKRRPTMFDGLGAAEIEQGSDWMFSCFRPHMHEQPDDDMDGWRIRQGVTEFATLKAKFGARGVFALRFDPRRMEFST